MNTTLTNSSGSNVWRFRLFCRELREIRDESGVVGFWEISYSFVVWSCPILVPSQNQPEPWPLNSLFQSQVITRWPPINDYIITNRQAAMNDWRANRNVPTLTRTGGVSLRGGRSLGPISRVLSMENIDSGAMESCRGEWERGGWAKMTRGVWLGRKWSRPSNALVGWRIVL